MTPVAWLLSFLVFGASVLSFGVTLILWFYSGRTSFGTGGKREDFPAATIAVTVFAGVVGYFGVRYFS